MSPRFHFSGKLYRALNPVYATKPLSTDGARLYGGRFNGRGMPALYTATTILGAVHEANQAGSLQPITLIEIIASIPEVFDTRDAAAMAPHAMTHDHLSSDTWRDEMIKSGASVTQKFAQALHDEGYNGLLVRSFAKGAAADQLNLVIWDWSTRSAVSLSVTDDHNRLLPTGTAPA